MILLALLLSSVLLAIAAIHAYWGTGGPWPEKDAMALAHAVVGDGRNRMPPPWSCFAVAAALVVVAAWPWLILTHPENTLVVIGAVIIAGLFFVRGSAGYSPRWRARFRTEPFATRDARFYSPLCMALATGFMALLAQEMQ
jgi:hypothetical protein